MSDEDDYMSDNFLAKAESIKPGVSATRDQRRIMKLEAERYEREETNRKTLKKGELEKLKREEALNKPISQESKGFALLAKMGFKPGMSLGKKKDEHDLGSGIKEPIPLDLKGNRKGFGREAEENSQRKQRIEDQMKRMKERADKHEELIDEYRKRKRGGSSTKQLIHDICKSRRVCLDLDMRDNISTPVVAWFWKSYKVVVADSEMDRRSRRIIEDDEDDAQFTYHNGQNAPKEVRFDELMDDELEDRLEQITSYLRDYHRYCVYCGCQFDNQEELESECPGSGRQNHDGHEDE